jgi:hypothetical protein
LAVLTAGLRELKNDGLLAEVVKSLARILLKRGN